MPHCRIPDSRIPDSRIPDPAVRARGRAPPRV